MGTTNIREALRLLDTLSDEAGDLVRSAEEEVAAIEQAARDPVATARAAGFARARKLAAILANEWEEGGARLPDDIYRMQDDGG